MNDRHQISIGWYAVTDYLAASLAWACFFFVRKALLGEPLTENGALLVDSKFWLGISLIPAAWLILYALVGTYHSLL